MLLSKKQYSFIIIILGIVAFYPILDAGYVNYDDPDYIIHNRYISEFTWNNIQYIFLNKTIDLYIPFTFLSYMIERALFGENAHTTHFINLLLHIVNTILLLNILLKLSLKNESLIYLILIFFLLNPLVTESVCWITERKDVLYTLFYFLAGIQFINYHHSLKIKHIILCFIFFVCACLSKPMAISFPILALIFLVYYYQNLNLRRVYSLIPFVLISIIISVISIVFINGNTSQISTLSYSLDERCFLLLSQLGFYFFKPFFPIHQQLIYFFPSPQEVFQNFYIIAYAISFLVICCMLYYFGIKQRKTILIFLFISWIVFLAPILQIVPNTHSYVNERYFYISIIFPLAILYHILIYIKISQKIFKPIYLICLVSFIPLCIKQSKAWKDTVSLFERELKMNPKNHLALNNLGYHYNTQQNFYHSLPLLKKAVYIHPANAMYLNNYAWALSQTQQTDSAINYLKSAIQIDPMYTEALSNLGICYIQKQNADSALKYFKKAFDTSPNDVDVIYNLGVCYYNTKHLSEALEMLNKAKLLGNSKAEKYLKRLNAYKDAPKK